MYDKQEYDNIARLNENRGQIISLCDLYFWLTRLDVAGKSGLEVLSTIEDEVYKRVVEV